MNEIFADRSRRKTDRRRGVVQGKARSISENFGDLKTLPHTSTLPAEDRVSLCPASPQRQGSGELDFLYDALAGVTPESNPRTAKLLESGRRKAAQKVIEEAGEVALAGLKPDTRGTVRESADLLYHLVVLWHRAGVEPNEVWAEMRRRAEAFGIAEKLPKPRHRSPLPPHLKR
jgi:phosphoribosyl-ATP pyrophosphohydrolase